MSLRSTMMNIQTAINALDETEENKPIIDRLLRAGSDLERLKDLGSRAFKLQLEADYLAYAYANNFGKTEAHVSNSARVASDISEFLTSFLNYLRE